MDGQKSSGKGTPPMGAGNSYVEFDAMDKARMGETCKYRGDISRN